MTTDLSEFESAWRDEDGEGVTFTVIPPPDPDADDERREPDGDGPVLKVTPPPTGEDDGRE